MNTLVDFLISPGSERTHKWQVATRGEDKIL